VAPERLIAEEKAEGETEAMEREVMGEVLETLKGTDAMVDPAGAAATTKSGQEMHRMPVTGPGVAVGLPAGRGVSVTPAGSGLGVCVARDRAGEVVGKMYKESVAGCMVQLPTLVMNGRRSALEPERGPA